MATRGSYVHNSMVKFSGVSRDFTFMQFSKKILIVSGKMIHRAFRTDDSLCAKLINLAWESLIWGGGGVTRNFIKCTLNGVSHYLTFAPPPMASHLLNITPNPPF